MRNLFDLLFPPKCASCGELLPFGGLIEANSGKRTALCKDCLLLWNREKEESCNVCGEKVRNCQCATKMMQSAGCNTFCKLFYYRPGNRQEVGNRVVYHIKDHADSATIRFLAEELAPLILKSMKQEAWKGKSFFLTYLPRRSGAVLKGGNDQAKELAVAIAKVLDLPVLPLIGRRRKSQMPQKFLSPAGRLSNVTEAFYLRETYQEEAEGKVAVLVDDIVTSGASMTVGVRLLRRAGAKGFLAVALASDECNRNPSPPASGTKGEA